MARGNSSLQRREAVTSTNEFLREIANEPSLGLYYLQEHVSTSVPALMEVKARFKECTKAALSRDPQSEQLRVLRQALLWRRAGAPRPGVGEAGARHREAPRLPGLRVGEVVEKGGGSQAEQEVCKHRCVVVVYVCTIISLLKSTIIKSTTLAFVSRRPPSSAWPPSVPRSPPPLPLPGTHHDTEDRAVSPRRPRRKS